MAQGPSPYASLKPSEKDLDFVASRAGDNWRRLLTHLGIKLSEIQRFFSKNSNDSRDACFEGLVSWLSSEVNDPEEPVTFGTLFQALREASMASCPSLLEEKLEARCVHKPATGGDFSVQPGTSKPKENPAMGNSSSKDHNTAKNQQTMQPSTTPVEDQRTLALREAREKLQWYYTKPAKCKHFVKLALVERPSKVDKTKKDAKEFLEATAHGIDRYTGEQNKIKYKTILTRTGSDLGKRVLISGSPGSGKTTLAHQLCRDLYSGDLPNQYQLVLFTELKAFRSYTNKKKKEASLLTLLEYLGLTEPVSLCSMIEKKEGREVAIILDGYDEISDPSCKTLAEWVSDFFGDAPHLKVSKCDMFITTRPSQLSELASDDSVHLEILGFSSSGIECYIKAYFKGAPDRARKAIRRLTKSLPLVRGLCSNPRVLEIACKVLKHLDEEPLPANLSGIFLRYVCYQLEVDLTQRQLPVKTRIKDLLSVPKDLFPGFYTLCSLAYHCCLRQQLMLEKRELGEVNNYINCRGSVYNLVFGKEVDSPSEMSCVLYQCDHKTVMEALAAVHIAVLSPAEQQQIWEEWFTASHMAQVWMMYCGLTGLKSVDLRRLCSLTVSERSREVMKDLDADALEAEDNLVMVSLFEAGNDEVAKRVLPVLLNNTIKGIVCRSQHNILVLAYSITHHPHLSRVWLHSLLDDCSELDLQPLTASLKNMKTIVELKYYRGMELILMAVLPRAVEDVSLIFTAYDTVSYKVLGDALRDCRHCLRSLTIIESIWYSALWTELDSVLTNNRLTEFHLEDGICGPPCEATETALKNLLVHRVKCSLKMELTNHQISALLSGLKRADKLKELGLEMTVSSSRGRVHRDQRLVTCAEVEELVATHPHLVKVDVARGIYGGKIDFLIAVAKGAIRNQNITHLGLGRYETRAVHPLLCSPSADHITSIKAEYYDSDDDAWSKGVIAGPMARQTCHLDLSDFNPASLGLLLSRVNTATKLKDLSLRVWIVLEEDQDPMDGCAVETAFSNCNLLKLRIKVPEKDQYLVDVRAVETAFSNCNLLKLRIKHLGVPPTQWCQLYSAILNGLAANTTAQVDSCIYGMFDVKKIKIHLSQQTLQRFKIVRTGTCGTFIISRDPSCPLVPRSASITPSLPTTTTEQDPSSDPQPQPMTTGQVSLSEHPAGVKELLEKYRDRIYSDVVSTAVSPRLEMEEVISEEVALEIKDKGDKKGNCLVYLHLLKQGDLQSLRTFSVVLKEETGNRKMQKLGEELLAELDQLQPAPSR